MFRVDEVVLDVAEPIGADRGKARMLLTGRIQAHYLRSWRRAPDDERFYADLARAVRRRSDAAIEDLPLGAARSAYLALDYTIDAKF